MDRGAVLQALERERQVLQLFARGLSWVEIAKQLGFADESGARRAFERSAKRFPKKDVELATNLSKERLNNARRQVYTELAGRQEPDPEHPGQMRTVRLSPDEVFRGVDRIVRIEEREAALLGLDAPKQSEVQSAVPGHAVNDEEIDVWLGRLTPSERETFMMLLAKAQGQWVSPPPIEDQGTTVETPATTVKAERGGGETSG